MAGQREATSEPEETGTQTKAVIESKLEEEEEGELEKSQSGKKKSTCRRKSGKEQREQDTYKDKLQGSQQNIERLLRNPRNSRKSRPPPIYHPDLLLIQETKMEERTFLHFTSDFWKIRKRHCSQL